LAREYECARIDPEIEIIDVNLRGDRKLILEHRVHDGQRLDRKSLRGTLQHIRNLWGYAVSLREVEANTGRTLPDGETEVP
jgi:stage V sporulation protein R